MPPSDKTLVQYNSILRRLEEAEITAESLVSEPEKCLTWIREFASPSKSVGTINNFLKAVLWKLREDNMEGATEPYVLEMKKNKPSLDIQKKIQDLPEHRKEKMLSWPEVLALGEKAKKELSAENYLIYCLYTMMPPLRADYSEIVVRKSRNTISCHTNHLIALQDTKKYQFVLNRYKTAETYGTVCLDIPEPLAKIIKEWLLSRVPTPENGKKKQIPYSSPFLEVNTPNALTKRVRSIFKQLCGKEMGIGLLRHSYIQHFLSVKRTLLEREEIAKKMLHSAVVQELYDVIEDSE